MFAPIRVVVVTALALLGLQVVAPAAAPARPAAAQVRCTVTGTPGRDVLRGTAGDDVICGRGGDDRLIGRGGDDLLRGGAGDDRLVGGSGDDRLRGGTGRDRLDGVDGSTYRDVLQCGPQQDSASADPPDAVRADCERVRQDHAPTTILLDPASVAEGQPAGTPVGTLAAVDPDPGDSATYDLVDGLGSSGNGSVVIDGDLLKTAAVLDHETQPTLSIRVRATDHTGLSVERALVVTVTDVEEGPDATDDAISTLEDTQVTVPAATLLANDSAAEGGPLTVTSVGGASHGTVSLVGTSVTFTPAADYCGSASFDYTVGDDHGSTDTATVVVTVTCVDDSPVAHDDAASVDEDAPPTAIDVLANDTDADGDPITVVSVAQPSIGTVAVTAGGTRVTYAPHLDRCSSQGADDTFTYTVNGGSRATVRVTVRCQNDGPVAVDDTLTATEDTARTVSTSTLLANDSDPDGDQLTVTAVGNAGHGTVGLVGSTVTFTPAPDYCGPASFDYTVSDGGETDTGTVAVTVSCVNDAPDAVGDSITTDEDVAKTVQASALLGNDVDVEGDTLTVTAVGGATHGSVGLVGTTITYTPTGNYCGPASFDYTVSDGVLTDTATVSVTVTCVNDAPDAVDDAISTNEDVAKTVQAATLLANDTDVDGDTLTVTAVANASHGTVGLVGTAVTYTPAADYCGSASYDYTVGDGHGGTDTATVDVTVTCVNDPPVAVDDSVTTSEDSSVSFASVLANDTDVEGGALIAVLVTGPAHGTLTLYANGTGSYTPQADYCNSAGSPDTFTYRAYDGTTTSAPATVSVTVTCVADDPAAVNDSPTVAEDSGATAVTVLANDADADGGPKSIASVTQPAHGTVAITGGGTELTYAPAANYCNTPPGTSLDAFT